LIKVFRPLNTFRTLIEAHLSTITSSNHCVYHAKHMKRRLHQTFNWSHSLFFFLDWPVWLIQVHGYFKEAFMH